MPKHVLPRCVFLFAIFAISAAANEAFARDVLKVKDDGSVEIAGQRMQCDGTPAELDRRIPSEGMFAPGEGILLNPVLMRAQPATVRKFIFAHECAHGSVSGELAADCAAAKRGAREQWLTPEDVEAVCRDLKRHVADADHPAGRVRCANVKRCYAEALPAPVQTASWEAVVTVAMDAWPAKRQAFGSEPKPSMAEQLRRAAGLWRSGFTNMAARD